MTPDLTKIKKILIVQYLPFGDVLLGTAYTEILKKLFNPEIHYLAAKPFDQILEGHPYIDKVVSFEIGKGMDYAINRIKILKEINKEKYDLVIDQLGKPSCKQMILFSGAKYKLGWTNSRMNYLLNLKAERTYHGYSSTRHLEILRPLGIMPQRYRLYIHVPENASKKVKNWMLEKGLKKENLIGIAPSSKDRKKKWNIDLFKELTLNLIETYKKKIILIYAPSEYEDALEVYNGVNHPDVFMSPSLNIKESAALLQNIELLISNDAAIHHMSVATATPSIAIFGPTDAQAWCAEGDFPLHYRVKNDQWVPESNKDDFGISVTDVMKKVEQAYLEIKNTKWSEDLFYCDPKKQTY